jgi:hypothetical protein
MQACLLVLAVSQSEGSAPQAKVDEPRLMLSRVVQYRRYSEALPGDLVLHRVRLQTRMKDGAVFSGTTTVGGWPVARVERLVIAKPE